MRIRNDYDGRGVEELTLYMEPTSQGLTYYLQRPDTSILGLDSLRIDFRDSRELDEFITVLTEFRKEIYAYLGEWNKK